MSSINSGHVISDRPVLSPSSPSAATIGVVSIEIAGANTARKGFTIVNMSAATVSLGFGAPAVLNWGITLNASGGVFEMDAFMFSTGAINAIASAAGSTIGLQEFT